MHLLRFPLRDGVGAILDGFCVILRFDFASQELAAIDQGLVPLRTDTGERGKNRFPFIGPQSDTPINQIQLERANVALIFLVLRGPGVQRFGFPDVVPYRVR